MTLENFIKEYDGTYVEVGGSANALNQCVDLANAWIMEGLGKNPIFGTNARDFWTVAGNAYIRVSPDAYPIKGDLVIWDIGSAGHIAIATGVMNGGRFQTFSQNYPLGSNSHLVDFTLKNLIGYLRIKPKESEVFMDENQWKEVCWNVVNGFYDKYFHRSATDKEVNAHVEAISKFEPRKYALSDWVNRQVEEAEFKGQWANKATLDRLEGQMGDALKIIKEQTDEITALNKTSPNKTRIDPRDCPKVGDPSIPTITTQTEKTSWKGFIEWLKRLFRGMG